MMKKKKLYRFYIENAPNKFIPVNVEATSSKNAERKLKQSNIAIFSKPLKRKMKKVS